MNECVREMTFQEEAECFIKNYENFYNQLHLSNDDTEPEYLGLLRNAKRAIKKALSENAKRAIKKALSETQMYCNITVTNEEYARIKNENECFKNTIVKLAVEKYSNF